MSIVIEEREGVTVRVEAFAPTIRIIGNPEDTLAGAVLVDLQTLTYHDDELAFTQPLASSGETVSDFIQRSWEINGKTITGTDMMLVVKRYVADLHDERVAANAPTSDETVDAEL